MLGIGDLISVLRINIEGETEVWIIDASGIRRAPSTSRENFDDIQ
jgi:hypothetical protein